MWDIFVAQNTRTWICLKAWKASIAAWHSCSCAHPFVARGAFGLHPTTTSLVEVGRNSSWASWVKTFFCLSFHIARSNLLACYPACLPARRMNEILSLRAFSLFFYFLLELGQNKCLSSFSFPGYLPLFSSPFFVFPRPLSLFWFTLYWLNKRDWGANFSHGRETKNIALLLRSKRSSEWDDIFLRFFNVWAK